MDRFAALNPVSHRLITEACSAASEQVHSERVAETKAMADPFRLHDNYLNTIRNLQAEFDLFRIIFNMHYLIDKVSQREGYSVWYQKLQIFAHP